MRKGRQNYRRNRSWWYHAVMIILMSRQDLLREGGKQMGWKTDPGLSTQLWCTPARAVTAECSGFSTCGPLPVHLRQPREPWAQAILVVPQMCYGSQASPGHPF